MAGYSGTPLARKLGIKEGHVVATIDEPPELPALLDLPPGAGLRPGTAEPADIVLLFVIRRERLEAELPAAAAAIFPAGAIWVAWPKRASKVPTDITEDTVREVALPARLVDNKVCAISDVWSGLRIVWRKEHRS
jgi:hypothetical protein